MTIEKFDRAKAQAHLDSHEGAVVLVEDDQPIDSDSAGYWHGETIEYKYDYMRLCYLTDTPPQTAGTIEVSGPGTIDIRHFTDEKPKEEPFRITGPGRYRQRDGGVAEVISRNEEALSSGVFAWIGKCAVGSTEGWAEDGRYFEDRELDYDLIARLPDIVAARFAIETDYAAHGDYPFEAYHTHHVI